MKALVHTSTRTRELDAKRMTVIVCKCESGNIEVPVIRMGPVVIRDRFMRTVESSNA